MLQLIGQILYIGLLFVAPIAYLFVKLLGTSSLEEDLVRTAERYYARKNLGRK